MKFNCTNCGNACTAWNLSKVPNVCLDCEIKSQTGSPLGIPKQSVAQLNHSVSQATTPESGSSALTSIGIFLLLAGAVGIYLALGIDTSVPTGISAQRVNNVGLIADKQNYILVSIAASVVGALFIGFGRR